MSLRSHFLCHPRSWRTTLVALGPVLLSGCVTSALAPDAPVAAAVAAADGTAAPSPEVKQQAGEDDINSAIAEVDDQTEQAEGGGKGAPVIGDEISHATSERIPLELNDDVQRWINFFTTKDHERFGRFLERGERYKPQVMAVLREQQIPTELFYQAMIESGFATAAVSKAKAVGIWQFMKETGRRYGLRVDSYVDERRDPMRATIAASLYLKDLYNVFQSWYLAIAAYNAGEGRIMNTIMRAKTRDFWAMVKLKVLPSETLNYIPKFLAATRIGHAPKDYGFDEISRDAVPQLVSVAVPAPLRLADIASTSGISLALLRELNPHLIRGMTPPGGDTYRIWVPLDEAAGLEALSDRLAGLRVKGLRRVAAAEPAAEHVVKPGETLARIAAASGLSLRQLRRLNHLRSSRVSPGTRLLLRRPLPAAVVQPRDAVAHAIGDATASASNAAAEPESASEPQRYRVRRGDSLAKVARRFGVTINDLKRRNGLQRSAIEAGQVLVIR